MKKILVPSLILLASCGNNSSTPTESTVYEEPTMTQEIAPTESIEEGEEAAELTQTEEEVVVTEIIEQKVSLSISRPFNTAKLDERSELEKFLANQDMYTVEVSLKRPADGNEYATCMRIDYFPYKTYEIRFEEGESRKVLNVDISDSTSESWRKNFYCEWGIIEEKYEYINTKLLRDKVLEGDVDASVFKKVNEFGVLYLKEGTVVDIQDRQVEIKAEALISKNAIFESFNGKDRTADTLKHGKDGGTIVIDAHYV